MNKTSQQAFEEWWNPLKLPTTHHEKTTRMLCRAAWIASEKRFFNFIHSIAYYGTCPGGSVTKARKILETMEKADADPK